MSDPLLTITSQEDAVELQLTREHVRMKLSEKVMEEFRSEVRSDPDVQAPGLIGSFVRAVTGAAEKLMSSSITYPIADIESVAYRDGALVFTYRKRHVTTFGDIQVRLDGISARGGAKTSALTTFAPADAENFVQQFAKVKEQSAH